MINLQFSYKPFMIISTEHEFFQKQENNRLVLVPNKLTARLMERLGFLMRTVDNRVDILFDQTKLEGFQYKLQQIPESQLKFSFYLYNRNPYFINVSDVPVEMVGRTFYCSNRHLNDASEGVLHKGGQLGESELYNNYQGKEDYVERGNENIELHSLINQTVSPENSRSAIEEGLYKVTSDARTLESVLSIESGVKGTPVALVDIFINSKMKSKLIEQLQEQSFQTLNYSLKFGARQIYWNYVVIPRYQKKLNKLKVEVKKSSDSPLFDALIQGETADGKPFLSSASKKSIKYSEQYDYEIQLKLVDGEGKGKVVVKRMPFAGFETIKPFIKGEYKSDIYVYI